MEYSQTDPEPHLSRNVAVVGTHIVSPDANLNAITKSPNSC